MIDLSALSFVALALAGAVVSGRFARSSLVVADAVVLPVGVTGTFIGVVQMLTHLDDPASIPVGFSVALLTSAYAALLKFCLGIALGERPECPTESAGWHGWLGASIWVGTFGCAAAMGTDDVSVFWNLDALLLFGVALAVVAGLTRASGSTAYWSRWARYLPFVGLGILFSSFVVLLRHLSDPPSMGPVLAVGLLSHLYCTGFAVVLNLARPDLVEPVPQISRWLYWAGSLAGVALLLGQILASLG